MPIPAWRCTQAACIDPACEQVIGQLLADNAPYRLRSAQGVVGPADRHDPAGLEAACARALAAGDPSYRTIKVIPAAGTEREQARPVSPTSSPCPAASPATRSPWPARAAGGTTPKSRCHDRCHDGHRPQRARPGAAGAEAVGDAADLRRPGWPTPTPGNWGYLEFLQVLCEDEISRCASVSLAKRIRRARFEQQSTLEGFDIRRLPETARPQGGYELVEGAERAALQAPSPESGEPSLDQLGSG